MKTIIIFSLLSIFSLPLYACSCKEYKIEEAFQTYDVIFIGKTLSIGEQSIFEGRELFREGINKIKFQVTQKFKGIQENITVVFTNNHSEACGYLFEENVEYAVFGYYSKSDKNDKKLYTSVCSPTIHVKPKNDDYEEIELLRRETIGYLKSL
jgi:hypothetical protein